MNRKIPNPYENLVRQPLVETELSTKKFSQDSPPIAPFTRFHMQKEKQYHSMVEDNSVEDSDGSNMTSVTTTGTYLVLIKRRKLLLISNIFCERRKFPRLHFSCSHLF